MSIDDLRVKVTTNVDKLSENIDVEDIKRKWLKFYHWFKMLWWNY
jgi:hypothetical protein